MEIGGAPGPGCMGIVLLTLYGLGSNPVPIPLISNGMPCDWDTGQSLCASSKVFRLTISSRSWVTVAVKASFSVEKRSTLACRFANHCFFRWRHLSAAILKAVLVMAGAESRK